MVCLIVSLCGLWMESSQFERDQMELKRVPTKTYLDWEEEGENETSPYNQFNDSHLSTSYPQSWLSSIHLLARRQLVRMRRMWMVAVLFVVFGGGILGVVMGTVFWDDHKNIYNVLTCLAFSGMFTFVSQIAVLFDKMMCI